MRERSAERRLVTLGTLRRRPRAVLPARAPPGAPLVAFFRTRGTVLPGPDRGAEPRPDPGGLAAALHPDRVQPLKAAPLLMKRHGRSSETTRGPVCVNTGTRAPHLCSANMTPHESALN